MLYIDKSGNQAEGDQVTADYLLNHCLDAVTGKYSNILYDRRDGHGVHFSTADSLSYRQRMKSALYSNQSGLCCYCLRRLEVSAGADSLEHISIEHIIPRSYDSTNCPDLAVYREAPGLSDQEIELRKDFENRDGKPQSTPPFPHNIAYGNFVASCKGSFPDENNGNAPVCCNLVRGCKQAYPAYFHNDIQNYVHYESDGSIIADQDYHHYDQLRKMISATKLFKRPLKDIRKLWYELRNCPMSDIENCSTEIERHILLSKWLTGLDIDERMRLTEKYKRDVQWKTFMLYSIFYTIMRQQHP